MKYYHLAKSYMHAIDFDGFPSFLLTRSISSLPVSQPDFLRIRGLYRFVVMQMLQISIHWNKWLGMLRICWVGCFWTDVSGVKSIFIFRYLQLMIRYFWLSGIDGIYSYILSSRMGSKIPTIFLPSGMGWHGGIVIWLNQTWIPPQ